MSNKQIVIVESEKERLLGRVWKALGRNNAWRRINVFILLLLLMGFLTAVVFLAGKYNLVQFVWTK